MVDSETVQDIQHIFISDFSNVLIANDMLFWIVSIRGYFGLLSLVLCPALFLRRIALPGHR